MRLLVLHFAWTSYYLFATFVMFVLRCHFVTSKVVTMGHHWKPTLPWPCRGVRL